MTTPPMPDTAYMLMDEDGDLVGYSTPRDDLTSYTRTDLIPKWIPVSEGLPDSGVVVAIGCDGSIGRYRAWWSQAHLLDNDPPLWRGSDTDTQSWTHEITHWRYIDPPEDV